MLNWIANGDKSGLWEEGSQVAVREVSRNLYLTGYNLHISVTYNLVTQSHKESECDMVEGCAINSAKFFMFFLYM